MNNERGMVQSELETFLKNAKIPMKVVRGLAFKALLEASKNGPVFYGMRYGSAPRQDEVAPERDDPEGRQARRRHAPRGGHARFPRVPGRGRPSLLAPRSTGRTPTTVRPTGPRSRRTTRSPADRLGSSTRRTTPSSATRLYAAMPTRAMQVIGAFKAAAPADATAARPDRAQAVRRDGRDRRRRPLRGSARGP